MTSRLAFRIKFAALLLLLPVLAAAAPPELAPARVMLVGMFHFANPGRDMVKTQVINVMAPQNQTYLDGLAERMQAFRPSDVLTECSPTEQARYDQEFKDYLAGSFTMPSNENYQIGFRVAKLAGLHGVTCFDEDKIGWEAEPMFDYMAKHEPQRKQELESLYKSIGESMSHEQETLSLPQLLQLTNDPARDTLNKSMYLRTNDVDAGGSFAGADASASWWHRNFRMYGNIQKIAAPGRRVIVLAGQGHTAIMKDLLAVDGQRSAEDVRPYLDAERAKP
jgi:hypothetical protein